METAEQQTLNEQQPNDSSSLGDQSGDLVSTVPVPEPVSAEEPLKTDEGKPGEKQEEGEKEGDKKAGTEGENKGAESGGEKPKGDDARLDKHPRFKQMVDTNRELREQNQALMSKVDALLQKTESGGQQTETPSTPKLQSFQGMSKDDLRDKFDEDPHDFLQNFAQSITSDVEQKFNQRLEGLQQEQEAKSQEQRFREAYNNFASKHEDFWDRWDSGEIARVMDQNPAHNAMSAYHELTLQEQQQSMQQQIDEAVEKARKEEREKLEKNQKAKRNVTYVPAATSEVRGQADNAPELKDSKKYGGQTSVLAQRLARRRQQQG